MLLFLSIAGAQTFTDSGLTFPVLGPSNVAGSTVTDVDGDGQWDLVIVAVDGLEVFRGSPSGFVQDTPPGLDDLAAGLSGDGFEQVIRGHSWVDVDRDGLVDLYFLTAEDAELVRADGNGAFEVPVPIRTVGSLEGVAPVDWDRDGDFDLLVFQNNNGHLYRKDGLVDAFTLMADHLPATL